MMRALVLDDEKRYRDHLKRYLERKGLDIHIAAEAAEAKEVVQRYGIDLMIVDIKLANSIDGLEFADWVKQRHADTALIVITGFNCPDYERRSANLGAVAYLEKPFSLNELETPLQRIFDQRGMLREIHRLEQELEASRETQEAQRVLSALPAVCVTGSGQLRYASAEGRSYIEALVDPGLSRPVTQIDDGLLNQFREAALEENSGQISVFRRDGVASHYIAHVRAMVLDEDNVLIVFFSEDDSQNAAEVVDYLWPGILLRAAQAVRITAG